VSLSTGVCVCVRALVHVCVRACVRVCVRVCVRACVRERDVSIYFFFWEFFFASCIIVFLSWHHVFEKCGCIYVFLIQARF
jgi:hypothetical protein